MSELFGSFKIHDFGKGVDWSDQRCRPASPLIWSSALGGFGARANPGAPSQARGQPRYLSELSNDSHERRRVWAGEPIGPPCPLAPTPVSPRKLARKPRRILPLGS